MPEVGPYWMARCLIRIVINLRLFVLLLIFIFPLFAKEGKTLTVSGNSMLPTLKSGDIVFLDTSNANKKVKNSDLVAIRFSNRKNLMVKRIIAIPNDSIKIEKEVIRVNGVIVSQCGMLFFKKNKRNVLITQLKRYNWKIPEGQVLVIGDNCSESYDSGEYGLISVNQIVGKIYSNVTISNPN